MPLSQRHTKLSTAQMVKMDKEILLAFYCLTHMRGDQQGQIQCEICGFQCTVKISLMHMVVTSGIWFLNSAKSCCRSFIMSRLFTSQLHEQIGKTIRVFMLIPTKSRLWMLVFLMYTQHVKIFSLFTHLKLALPKSFFTPDICYTRQIFGQICDKIIKNCNSNIYQLIFIKKFYTIF